MLYKDVNLHFHKADTPTLLHPPVMIEPDFETMLKYWTIVFGESFKKSLYLGFENWIPLGGVCRVMLPVGQGTRVGGM